MNKDIIGISIGSKNTVIGTYKKGVFQIVLSDTSSRTIPTVISYSEKERNFGDIAFNRNRTNFKSTIIYPNRWLGIKFSNPLIEQESKFANLLPKKNEFNNSIGFNIDIKGQKIFHTPEVIMGSFFNRIKNLWINQDIVTDNIVVSVPDYYTVQERQAMLDSIYISGLNCQTLLNESSAISINYAFQKLKELNNDIPRLVCFIDLGHSQLTIFYAEFTTKFIKILSVSSERFCGARDMDLLIAEKISYEFQKQNGIDFLDIPKAKISLINAINKVRKNLTVNREDSISIDEITKGKDLTYNLKRDEFEQIIAPVLKKFENLCVTSLAKLASISGYNINNIHSIEMVGDTLRTPCFTNIIKKIYNKELSKTLIPDECIAKGCTLYAMMMNPTFYKLQNFSIKHYNPYQINLELPIMKEGKIENNTQPIFYESINFPFIQKFNSKKYANTPNELSIKFKYNDTPELNYFNDKLIMEYIVHFDDNKEVSLEFEYGLNINCFPKINKIICKDNNEQIKISLKSVNYGLTKEYLDLYRNEEMQRDEQDLVMKEVIKYKNYLEEYIYKTRNIVENDENLSKYLTQQEKEKLVLEMDILMEWLYSEDKDLYNIEKLEKKSKAMKQLGDLMYYRLNGWDKIKENYEKVESFLYEKLSLFIGMEEEFNRGKNTEIKIYNISKIKEYIQKEFNNLGTKIYDIDVADKSKKPTININDLENMVNVINQNIEKIKNN